MRGSLLIADLFSRLQPVERHFVARALGSCPRLRVAAGETCGCVEVGPSWLLLVERGVVAVVSERPTGRRMLVAIAGAGELLGGLHDEQCLLALQDATIVAVTARARSSLLGCPAVADAIVEELLARLCDRDESLAQFGAVAHLERVRAKMLQLARLHGKSVDGGAVELQLPLTHALIAEMVGSARETVSGAVRALEREGFLARERGRYRLPNRV